VIPMTMPEDGSGDSWPEGEGEALVGRTTMSGTLPVEPMGLLVGRTIVSGSPPVEPVSGVGVGITIRGVLVGRLMMGLLVGSTMISGSPPVEPTSGLVVGRALTALLVGSTIMSGSPPVEPAPEPDVGVTTRGALVGRTMISGSPPVEPLPELGVAVGWETVSEGVWVDPGTIKGPRKLDDSTEDGSAEEAGDAVGVTTVSGMPPVEPIRCPVDPVDWGASD
jgi:hypothetical protein